MFYFALKSRNIEQKPRAAILDIMYRSLWFVAIATIDKGLSLLSLFFVCLLVCYFCVCVCVCVCMRVFSVTVD